VWGLHRAAFVNAAPKRSTVYSLLPCALSFMVFLPFWGYEKVHVAYLGLVAMFMERVALHIMVS
jgi:hypothetical protein